MRLVLISAVLISTTSGKACDGSRRGKIQFYFDSLHWTCFSYPVDCQPKLKISQKLYDSEEECTLSNMGRLWKSYTLSCPPHTSMASYKRSSGDIVPYIFSSELCSSYTESEFCQKDESCSRHNGFAFCCKERAFDGLGPNQGTFNFTGLGGKTTYLKNKVKSKVLNPQPHNCNLDGDRVDLEWYPHESMGCLSRRKSCSSPAFSKNVTAQTYDSLKECHDTHYKNLRLSYRLRCMPGYTPAKFNGTAIIFKLVCQILPLTNFAGKSVAIKLFCRYYREVGCFQTLTITSNLTRKTLKSTRLAIVFVLRENSYLISVSGYVFKVHRTCVFISSLKRRLFASEPKIIKR